MRNIKRKKRESGSALIASLVLIFTASMLTMAVLALSQTAALDIRAHTQLQRSTYINEGVSNRIQWLIAADRQLFTDSSPGEVDYSQYDHDRFMPDGIEHKIDYYGTEVAFTIFGANSGLDLGPANYRATLNAFGSRIDLDTATTDAITEVSAKLQDYFDTNNDLTVDGMEVNDYDAENMAPLPRNSTTGFLREELFYIKGLTGLFPPDRHGRLSGLRLTGAPAGTPNFFTATPLLIQIYCNLEESQVETVVAARKLWFQERTQLKDQLDPLLYSSLSRLTWRDVGSYTIVIGAPKDSKRPSRRLVFSCQGFGIAGATDNMVYFLEWMYF